MGKRLSGDLRGRHAGQVKETSSEVEARLWAVVRDFVALARANPSLLVSAVRIIEMQEMVDEQGAGGREGHRKSFKSTALSQVGHALSEPRPPCRIHAWRHETASTGMGCTAPVGARLWSQAPRIRC